MTRIKKVFIEEAAQSHAMTGRIISMLQKRSTGQPLAGEEYPTTPLDKEALRLVSFPGEFLKPCPGTKSYICCGYQILNAGTQCPLDCSYCILQSYFDQPDMKIFVNLENKLEEIGAHLDKTADKLFRIGTGEFMDSLALDPYAGWSAFLPGFIHKRRNAVLEFKTKTDRVEGLLSSKTKDRIIVSWSLNSPSIAAREEHGAPPVRKRLTAAKACQDAGFAIGFHFDPIIQHLNWKEQYVKTLEMMEGIIDPSRVVWISLGCLRFMPNLKSVVLRRHKDTRILDGEFIPGLDGKMRYFKPIRIELYNFIKQQLDAWHKDLGLYLCMESDEVWNKAMGWSPENSEGLSRYLDQRALKFFPELRGLASKSAQ